MGDRKTMSYSIQTENGGWTSLDNYCDSKPKGSGLRYLNIGDDELNVLELGTRVTNYIAEKEATGWDALMDMAYDEYCQEVL